MELVSDLCYARHEICVRFERGALAELIVGDVASRRQPEHRARMDPAAMNTRLRSLRIWCGAVVVGTTALGGALAAPACDRREHVGRTMEAAAALNADIQQQGLAERLEELGDRQLAARELAAARTAYEGAKDIRVRLMGLNDAPSLQAAATSFTKLGSAIVQADRLQADRLNDSETRADDEARKAFEQATDLLKRLVAADPGHLGRLRALADSYFRLADALDDTDDWPAARAAGQAVIDIRVRLVQGVPHDPDPPARAQGEL